MKRAIEYSIWAIIAIGVSLITILTLARFVFPSVSLLGEESKKLTLNAIKSIDCSTNKIDLRDLAYKTLNDFLQQIGLYKFRNILLRGDPTIDNVYSNCVADNLPASYCEAIRLKLKDYCYRNILKYTFGSADSNTVYKTFGCVYILFNGDLALSKKSIVCCTPHWNELIDKFKQCGFIEYNIGNYLAICGNPVKVEVFYSGEDFRGETSEVCKSYLLDQITNFEKNINFYLQ